MLCGQEIHFPNLSNDGVARITTAISVVQTFSAFGNKLINWQVRCRTGIPACRFTLLETRTDKNVLLTTLPTPERRREIMNQLRRLIIALAAICVLALVAFALVNRPTVPV